MSNLALLGGQCAKTKPFPIWPQYDDTERELLLEVLESRKWWRTEGTKTAQLEYEFAAYHNAKYGIAITNGTHALEVALAALGLHSGDEVIVPNSTFIATASAVLFTGALPVPVDVERDSFNIDPDAVEAAITERTKAIIAVHLGGMAANLDRLLEIARRHNLKLIEDSAHAHGSEWRGRKIGAIGTAGTFSFQSSKTMTAGEGGMIISNESEFERLARSVHDCGRMPGEWFYSHYIYGSNYRLSEWQGAILLAQLARLDQQTARRDHNGRLLDGLLSQIDGITPQLRRPENTRNGHYAYIVHYDSSKFANVPALRFIEALKAEGIPNQSPYPPVHALDVFQSGAYRTRLGGDQAGQLHAFLSQPFPNSERAFRETIWIPQAALLGDDQDMHEIVAAFTKIQQSARELC
jgi:dTDP-4-amino-4,6-dideoxygalactose transaminase